VQLVDGQHLLGSGREEQVHRRQPRGERQRLLQEVAGTRDAPRDARARRRGRERWFSVFDRQGRAHTLVASGLPKGGDIGVESVGFIPERGPANALALLADRGGQAEPHPGDDAFLGVTVGDLLRAGARRGDLLAATEGGAQTIAVRCPRTCHVRHVADGPATAHAEGHVEGRAAVFVLQIQLGPLISEELDEAIDRANDTEYGLTAGLFSEDEQEIQEWLDRIHAGVVYVNRRAGSTTGAWPGVQPFGGWKGSGTTGKAGGGPYYVTQYLREQSRTVIEE